MLSLFSLKMNMLKINLRRINTKTVKMLIDGKLVLINKNYKYDKK